MKMTPALIVLGSLLVLWASIFISVILPTQTIEEQPAGAWRKWTPEEAAGHDLYVRNGCSYCHSQFVRVMDHELYERVAEKNDYYDYQPAILGTERTGPDLSQEGGFHSDDWQRAHFANPRNTRPLSLMPSWEFLGEDDLRKLTAYMQSLGGREADFRVQRQRKYRGPAQEAHKAGPDRNVQWLHDNVPPPWRPMPNPYPPTDADLGRGKLVYQQYCIGCHGPMGDGKGPAAAYMDPPPLNFTELRGRLVEGKYIGGILYYQIMNGITGTAMPVFKHELESANIWNVSNYVAVYFLGYADSTIEPRGIPASYEPNYVNPYKPPTSTTTKEARP